MLSQWTAATTLRDPPEALAPGAPGVVAHVPEGLDPRRRLHLVIFFHGAGTCAAQIALGGDGIVCEPGGKPQIGAGLAARHDDAGTQTIFAAPQFSLWASGSPGRFDDRTYFGKFLAELLGETFAPGLAGAHTLDDLDGVTLVAHSAGHIPLLAILERSELRDRVRNVVLIDALYDRGASTYLRWLKGASATAPRKLVSVHSAWGVNAAHARAIAAAYGREHPDAVAIDPSGALEDAIRAHAVTLKTWPIDHGWMPLLVITKTLAGLDLAPRAVTPDRTPVPSTLRAAAPLDHVAGASLDYGDMILANGAAADDYAITLREGEYVGIEVRGDRSWTEPCCTLDVFVQLLAPDGHEIVRDDDGAGFFDARLEAVAPAAGTYTIRVTTSGSGMKRGPYALNIRTTPR
jgi:hypothetical protein